MSVQMVQPLNARLTTKKTRKVNTERERDCINNPFYVCVCGGGFPCKCVCLWDWRDGLAV